MGKLGIVRFTSFPGFGRINSPAFERGFCFWVFDLSRMVATRAGLQISPATFKLAAKIRVRREQRGNALNFSGF